MTVREALRKILDGWTAREQLLEARLYEIDNEKLALVSLLRTVQRSKQIAQTAVDMAAEVPRRDGGMQISKKDAEVEP